MTEPRSKGKSILQWYQMWRKLLCWTLVGLTLVFGLRRAMVPAIVSSSTLIECELYEKTSQVDMITRGSAKRTQVRFKTWFHFMLLGHSEKASGMEEEGAFFIVVPCMLPWAKSSKRSCLWFLGNHPPIITDNLGTFTCGGAPYSRRSFCCNSLLPSGSRVFRFPVCSWSRDIGSSYWRVARSIWMGYKTHSFIVRKIRNHKTNLNLFALQIKIYFLYVNQYILYLIFF